MFKVRRKGTDEIIPVLSVYMEDITAETYFFIWENNGWRWRPSEHFVPPNFQGDRE